MTELDFEKLQIPEEAYKAIKKAARSKNRVIRSCPDSLSTAAGLYYVANRVSDGMGGLITPANPQQVLNDDGVKYVRWHKRKTVIGIWKKTKKFFVFWIPVAISIASLIVSIIALNK